MPGFRKLYQHDLTIARAANAVGFGLMVAGGVWWATQPVPGALPATEPSFEAMVAPWGITGGLVVSAMAAIVLVMRLLFVKKVLTQGATIKGMVEDIDVLSYETHSDTRPTGKRSYRHSYFATLRFTSGGVERKLRLKLPNSGFTYGLAKGQETDLMVLDTAPSRPLIKAIYINRLR